MCFRDSHEYSVLLCETWWARACEHVSVCVCVCVCLSDTHFPRGRPVVFIKFSKGSLTQKRFRRLQSSALKGAFVSVKLAKFQPKVGQSD